VSAAPRHLSYTNDNSEEQLLAFGADDAIQRIMIIPPLFDEMNRVRHTLVETMREMAQYEVTSALPDLPGCNESAAKLEDQSIETWREAISGAAETFGATHIFSIRGGCLIDDGPLLPTMRLAQVKGQSLLKALVRTRIAGDKETGVTTSADALAAQAKSGAVELAGSMIGPQLWSDLENAVPSGLDHLISDMKLADIAGTALWLRAEPQYDASMAARLAKALAHWSMSA